jgi:hypothetical protein
LAGVLPADDNHLLAARLKTAAVGLQEVSPEPVTLSRVMRAVDLSIEQRFGVRLEDGTWSVEELRHARSATG